MIDLDLFTLSLKVAPFDATEIDYDPGTDFQCELSDEEHDLHGAFLRMIPENDKHVFYFWDSIGSVDHLVALSLCNKPKPEHKEPCGLWRGHVGKCEWGMIDPVNIALTAALDQAGPVLRELVGIPDLLKRLRPPESEV
ncbi:hypothetical protein ACWD1Y_06445 [Streptomyces sp. NPDC002814]